ncbi:MAG: tyrosine--tRNA ligase, partial [Flavobacteriaceae bacterium]
KIKVEYLNKNPNISDFLYETKFFSSKSEINRAIKQNSISINKVKVNFEYMLDRSLLICQKYILVQRGKKNYYLVLVE